MHDLNNNITSDNVDGALNSSNEFFVNFNDKDYGLTDIIKMPLNLIQSMTTLQNTTFTAILPYVNKQITFPNMRAIYQNFFGEFYVLYQLITTGIIGYYVVLNIFRIIKNIKDPNDNNIEVVEL